MWPRPQLLGVVTTNALELGVDIGSLDAVVMLGYPGSASSLWQQVLYTCCGVVALWWCTCLPCLNLHYCMVRLLQAGRAGRSGRKALTIMVAWDSPLEQHFVRHPNDMLQRPIEVQSSACCGKRTLTH